MLFATVETGQSDGFGFGFTTLIWTEKAAINHNQSEREFIFHTSATENLSISKLELSVCYGGLLVS